jgi:hypothetical protein
MEIVLYSDLINIVNDYKEDIENYENLKIELLEYIELKNDIRRRCIYGMLEGYYRIYKFNNKIYTLSFHKVHDYCNVGMIPLNINANFNKKHINIEY